MCKVITLAQLREWLANGEAACIAHITPEGSQRDVSEMVLAAIPTRSGASRIGRGGASSNIRCDADCVHAFEVAEIGQEDDRYSVCSHPLVCAGTDPDEYLGPDGLCQLRFPQGAETKADETVSTDVRDFIQRAYTIIWGDPHEPEDVGAWLDEARALLGIPEPGDD